MMLQLVPSQMKLHPLKNPQPSCRPCHGSCLQLLVGVWWLSWQSSLYSLSAAPIAVTTRENNMVREMENVSVACIILFSLFLAGLTTKELEADHEMWVIVRL